MAHFFLKLNLIFLLSFFVGGCASLRKPFFYEISRNTERAYLLGTIHIGVPLDVFPSVVLEKFDESSQIGIEVDPFDPQSLKKEMRLNQAEYSIVQKAARNVLAQNNKSLGNNHSKNNLRLSQRISSENWNYIKDLFLPFFKEESIIQSFSPATAFYLLVVLQPPETEIFSVFDDVGDIESSMDLNLLERARQQEKKITFLDGSGNLLSENCRDHLYEQYMTDWIRYRGKNMSSHMNSMRSAYRTGREERLKAELEFQLSQPLLQCLLSERNKKWVTVIESEVREANQKNLTPPFYAFGAGHLIGPEGVLELLRMNGFTVRRVNR
ncbi:MAG: hypothetical protein A2622_14065 [Bdellovibrionales bacterium RIFCSPHIGHO2_01_FULL_40_29]|nr:MAG: hypothetical protein A2622_14065 [Bdellovibrionales bacterium RIFCSPHIGHO2_01_FULL_40_29]OFZ33646.1 MAG: hypothetical protein A3D17_11675 [Bdellovibrionales bacterium RIFCSPHIGHO2_02_FULL_40_15]